MERRFVFPFVREVLPPKAPPPAPPDKNGLSESQRRLVAASLLACPVRKS